MADPSLIERLRNDAVCQNRMHGADPLCAKAASTLEDQARLLGECREGLEFYADPENYHAIGFRFDRPCGWFEDDFDEDHGHEDYDRPMPGKRARALLTKLNAFERAR